MAPRFTSNDSTSSSNIRRSDPCDRCRLTTCPILHGYAVSSCPYRVCQECRDLEVLDAQIAKVQDQLIDLTNKRRELKKRIDFRHDRTSHLPFETLSHIFSFLADESLRSVVVLGVVCKRWREITLGTPQLWTKITVDRLNVEDASLPNLIEQWSSRSCGLPLSLTVNLSHSNFGDLPQPSINLLRSQVHRWKDFTLLLQDRSPTLEMILMGLDDSLIVDSLTIQFLYPPPPEVDQITMKYPFVPKRLDIHKVPLSQIPIEWERLTHLDAWCISADSVIHVFDRAHNLQHCVLAIVEVDAGHYRIPAFPVTNTSIKELHIGDCGDALEMGFLPLQMGLLLNHLTLSSLEILRYDRIDLDVDDNGSEMGAIRLRNFLDRSNPPLRVFFVSHYLWGSKSISSNWFQILPDITSLELEANNIKRLQDYLKLLGFGVEPQALPCLRELYLEDTRSEAIFLDRFWNDMAGLFPSPEGNRNTPLVTVVRPLKTVTFRTTYRRWDSTQEFMSKAARARFRAIQRSGVKLYAFDKNGVDLLELDTNLTFYGA